MTFDVLIRPTAFFGVASSSLMMLGESLGVGTDKLVTELGTGGTLLLAFYWLVKGIRKQDHIQQKELTTSWQATFEKISEAQREAWAAHTEILAREIKETRSDVAELKSLVVESN